MSELSGTISLEDLPVPAALLAPDGTRMRCNALWQDAFGTPDPSQLSAAMTQALEPGSLDGSPGGMRVHRRQDGALLAVAESGFAKGGKSHGHDLQLMQADKMVSLGILVSGVAHEINNPNNLVLFNADLVGQVMQELVPRIDAASAADGTWALAGLPWPALRDELQSLLAGIAKGGERIRDIVARLKDFARVDTGRQDQEFTAQDLIDGTFLIIGTHLRKSTENLRIDIDMDLPRLRGCHQQIEQVLINLLTNASQALRSRSEAIEIRAVRGEGNSVEIQVRDEGCGIQPDDMARIFTPFFTTKRDSGGTGLGLSVSFRILQEHGGRLLFQSTPGAGTLARMILPGLPG